MNVSLIHSSRGFLVCALFVLVSCGGGDSPTASASPAPPPPATGLTNDKTPPSVPGSVVASASSAVSILVSWQAATDNVGVAGYRVFRDGSEIATTGATSFTDSGLTPATTYRHEVLAFDAVGNASAPVAAGAVTTPVASGRVISATPNDYIAKVDALVAGDTLVLAPGNYDIPAEAPGLRIFGLNGTPTQPITITGPDSGPLPVLLGRATHNTIRFDNASYVIVRNIEVDGRDLGGDGVNAQGVSHHITLENLVIRGVGGEQSTVGIATHGAPTWNWVIRRNTILRAGTGMYLGNSPGDNPFVAGIIENNLVVDTLGYNLQIKQQNPRPAIAGMPTVKSTTIIRHNVFSKAANAIGGASARPNLLVGHFPTSGPGMDDVYDIHGNFLYQNPTEALFQGEGNIAFHDNVLFNDAGDGANIQPHNDVPKMIRVFSNTIVARDSGVRVSGGSAGYTQEVIGNAVFAAAPMTISGSTSRQADNVTGNFVAAASYLINPTGVLGQLDLYPKAGTLRGAALDTSTISGFSSWNRDFNGGQRDWTVRGAYATDTAPNPGWLPKLERKP